jgi:hypothetical protein
LWIVNDGADEFPSSKVGLEVASDFHFELVETLRNGFLRQLNDFVV